MLEQQHISTWHVKVASTVGESDRRGEAGPNAGLVSVSAADSMAPAKEAFKAPSSVTRHWQIRDLHIVRPKLHHVFLLPLHVQRPELIKHSNHVPKRLVS